MPTVSTCQEYSERDQVEQQEVRMGCALQVFIDFPFRGINVLNNKSELQKALEKQRKHSNQKLKETENESCSQFDKILAERAERLLKVNL